MRWLSSVVIGSVLLTSLASSAQAFTSTQVSGNAGELSAAAALLLAPPNVQPTGFAASNLTDKLTSSSPEDSLFVASAASRGDTSSGESAGAGGPATFSKKWTPGFSRTPFAAALTDSFLPQAFVYTEDGDAGDLLSSAQTITATNVTGTPPGLATITGILATTTDPDTGGQLSDIDLFAISLLPGTTFSAAISTSFDPESLASLYLFDSAGLGLGYNADGFSFEYAVSSSADPNATYYLGVADLTAVAFGDPTPADSSNNDLVRIFQDGERGQTVGVENNVPLAEWSNGIDGDPFAFDYTVSLTNAGLAPIPEPSIGGGLLALGSLSLAALGRKRKSSLEKTL